MAGAMLVLQGRSLGDQRRLQRLRALVTALVGGLEQSLPQALAHPAALKAAYRFLASRAVTPASILATARQDVLARCADAAPLLLLQDTTTISIPRAGAQDLGPVGTRAHAGQGFFVHTVLAADSLGLPLGVLGQRQWVRPQAESDSARGAALEAESLALLPADQPVVTVADREGDIFAWFAAPRRPGAPLLVRVAQQQRRVDEDGGHLATTLAAQPVQGRYTVAVPAAPGRPARTAICAVRWTTVTLRPPHNRSPGTPRPAPVRLGAILATEEPPPAGGTPLSWLLLTSWPLADSTAVYEGLFWYTQRWLIERFHAVLKVGCGVERLQLRTLAAVQNALAVASIVAVQVLWLTDRARAQPDLPCTVAFSAAEWQMLVCVSTRTTTPPTTPPTLHAATHLTARLGGFLGRRGDGDPEPKTLWRGLQRLGDFVQARALFDHPPPVTGCG